MSAVEHGCGIELAAQGGSTIFGLEVDRALIASWLEQKVPNISILAALRREHGHTGSYSSVYRMIVRSALSVRPRPFLPYLVVTNGIAFSASLLSGWNTRAR